jgi:hypothetical protein
MRTKLRKIRRDHFEGLVIDERVILKWISRKQMGYELD